MSAIGICVSGGGSVVMNGGSLTVTGTDIKTKSVLVDSDSSVTAEGATAMVNGKPETLVSTKIDESIRQARVEAAIKHKHKTAIDVNTHDLTAHGKGDKIIKGSRVVERVYPVRTKVKLLMSGDEKQYCSVIAEPGVPLKFGTIRKATIEELKANPFTADAHRYDYETQGRHAGSVCGSGSFRVRDKGVVFLVEYYHCYKPSKTGFWVDGADVPLPH